MRLASLVLAVTSVSTACGGDSGKPIDAPIDATSTLAPATYMYIVAHQGDDLRYMQPDLGDEIASRGGVTTIYVTDGTGEDASAKADADHRGVELAYAALAGMPSATWACGTVMLDSQPAEHCRLDAAKLSLVFLGYPASAADGSSTNSLLHLWEAKVTSVSNPAVARMPTYSQVSLIASVAAAINATGPTSLRTLEVASTHGADHSDHMLVGALAVLAMAASSTQPLLSAYRGDNIAGEPANAVADSLARTANAYGLYAACATGCAACGTACTTSQLSATDAALIQRSYAIAFFPEADGQIKLGTDCVRLPQVGANGTVGSCTDAPTWELDVRGKLESDAKICMKAILTGEIVGSDCTNGGAGARFFLDSENHLWNGVVPGAQADMTTAHLQCLGNSGGRPRDQLCGATNAPVVDGLGGSVPL